MRLFGFHVTPVCFSLRVVDFYTVKGCFLSPLPDCRAPLLHQPGICLSRLISRAFFFSPDTFNPATARRYTILPPHSTHSNGSRFRNCFTTCTLKWHTEFGHLNRGDMLTSEQHRCSNEKKKFQRRV